MPMTAGTNTPETLSASLAMGALVAAASLTILMICDRVVSSPTRVASQRRKPDWFTVAALTRSPAVLSTGMLSPVRAASFTELSPLSTTPSTGMLSPGRTTNTSPRATSEIGTLCSLPPRSTTAVWGARRISDLSASVVRPFERASSILPTVMRVTIMAADSKYKSCISAWACSPSPFCTARVMAKRVTVLYAKDTPEPRATSVSMLGAPCTRPLKPLVKNFWLMSMTITASSSSARPMPTWLPSRKAGRGKPHMAWPMDRYISTSKKPSELTSRRFKTGVSRSRRASSSAAGEAAFCAPFFDAP